MSDETTPELDAASILFPDDVPAKRAEAPDWFKAQQSGAQQRLMGNHGAGAKADPAGKPEGGQAGSEGASETDAAETLFGKDTAEKQAQFNGDKVFGFLEARAHQAAEFNEEGAAELREASKALTADAIEHGTPEQEFADAMDVIRERHDFLEPPSEAELEAERDANLETLQSELGDTFEADLDAARRFVQDLDKVAPGTIESLVVSGAGNDMRLIRAAIKEAKRRGY